MAVAVEVKSHLASPGTTRRHHGRRRRRSQSRQVILRNQNTTPSLDGRGGQGGRELDARVRELERGRECRDRPMLFGFPQMFSHFGTRGIKETTKVLNYKYARTPAGKRKGTL